MSSQSDHYRRLFSGTLGVLPIVFPNRALGGTLVHFLRDLPYNTIRDKSQTTPCTRVDDVGEVELEVAGAAGADVDGAAGAEALRAAAEDEAAAGVALRPADAHALGLRYIKNRAVKRSIGFTICFHNHGEGPY